MSPRKTLVLIVAVATFFLAAIGMFTLLNGSEQRGYHRKVVDGIECMVNRRGTPIDCNWGSQ